MHMKRKIISTTFVVLGLIIAGYVILTLLGLFKEQEAGILIESEPIATVFIDGQEVGRTPYEINRKSGGISLKIKPDQKDNLVLDDYETKINLVPGIKTIVKKNFRETEDLSSGIIVSFEKLGGRNSYVTVISVPDNSQVIIDGKVYGYTPLRVEIPAGDHNLIVSSDKYLEKSLPIRVYSGYKLTASVKLAKANQETKQESVVLGESLLNTVKIKINKTDIGFLRVRSGANTGFPEIGQVKPDEEYDILEEGENGNWFKIKLVNSDGQEIEGWVSAEFVTKISP